MVQVAHPPVGLHNAVHILRRKLVFQLAYGHLLIPLADAHVLLQGGDHQVGPAPRPVQVGELEGAQGLEGALLHRQAVQPHPGGVVVVEHHEAPVGGLVHVGLNAEILCPVARGYKGCAGVLPLQPAQPPVGDHFYMAAVQFNGIHGAKPRFSLQCSRPAAAAGRRGPAHFPWDIV